MKVDYDIEDDYLHKLVKELLLHTEHIDKEVAKNIAPVLAKSFFRDKKVVEQIVKDNKLQSLLVQPLMIVNMVNLITAEKDELFDDKLLPLNSLLSIKNDLFDSNTSDPIISKICTIHAYENTQVYENRIKIKESKSKFCYQLLSKIISKDKREKVIQESLDKLLNILTLQNADIHWNEKYHYLDILYKLRQIDNNDSILKIDQNILSFVSNSDYVGFERFYAFSDTYDILIVDENTKGKLIERAISDEEFLRLIYINNKNLQTEILLRLLITNPTLFIQFLKEIKYEIDNIIEVSNSILEETAKNIQPQLKHNLYAVIDKINPSREDFEYNDFTTQLMNNYISQNLDLQRSTTLYLNDSTFFSLEDKEGIISQSLATFISNPQANFSIITNIITEIKFDIDSVLDGFYKTYKEVYDKFFFEVRNVEFIKLFFKRISLGCRNEILKTLFENIEEHISKDINSDATFSPFLNEIINEIDSQNFSDLKGSLYELINHYLEKGRNPEVSKTGINYIKIYKSLNRNRITKDFQSKLQSLYHTIINDEIIGLLRPLIKNSSNQINLTNQPIEAGSFDDDIYNEVFDLRKYSYTFSVKLKSIIDYWRLGFILSPNGSFHSKTQRTVQGFPLIHLTKNNIDKLALTFYFDGVNKSILEEELLDKYKKQEIIISITKKGTNAIVSFFNKNKKSLHSDVEINNLHFFKLFAWADAKNEFDIDVVISRKK
jgi:hypothetical protein